MEYCIGGLQQPAEENLVALILDSQGMIQDCNETGQWLFGLSPGKLFTHISTLLPELTGVSLIQKGQINPRLRFLSHIGRKFTVVVKNSNYMARIFIHDLQNTDLKRVLIDLRMVPGMT